MPFGPRVLALTFAALVLADSARAELRPLMSSGDVLVGQRVAVARSLEAETRWIDVSVEGPGTRFWLVVPVPSGAVAQVVDGAFLDALDAATTPQVVNPSDCGAVAVEAVSSPLGAPARVTAEARAATWAEAERWLAADGAPLSAADQAALTDPESAYSLLRLDGSGGLRRSVTVRLRSPVRLALQLGMAARAPLTTLFVLGAGRGELAGVALQAADELALNWLPALGRSDYRSRRLDLTQEPGHFILESVSSAPFLGQERADGRRSPSWLTAYYERVSSVNPCGDGVEQALSSMSQPLGPLCDGVFNEPSCGAGVVNSAVELRCEGHDDVAIALSGMPPSLLQLTRLTGRPKQLEHELTVTGGTPARSLELVAGGSCTGAGGAPPTPVGGTDGIPPEEVVVVASPGPTYVESDGCATGSSSSSAEPSYADSSDSGGGCTPDSTEEEAASSDDSADGCASEDEADSSADDSASGCAGEDAADDTEAASDAADDCTVAPVRRGGPIKLNAVFLALGALVLFRLRSRALRSAR